MPATPPTRHRHSPAHLPSDPGGGQSRPRQGESQRRRTAQKEELDVGTQLSQETPAAAAVVGGGRIENSDTYADVGRPDRPDTRRCATTG